MWSWFWGTSVNNTLLPPVTSTLSSSCAPARNAQTEDMSELKSCVFVTRDMIVNQLNSLRKTDKTERPKTFKSRNPIVIEIEQTILQIEIS